MLLFGLGLSKVTSAQQPTSNWSFALGVRESARYDRSSNGISEDDQIVDNATASLGYTTRTARGRFGLFGRIGGDIYREGEGSDRVNYGGGFSWEYQPSERLTTQLSQNVTRGFMVPTLSELGLLAPNLDTLAAATSWGLSYRLSPYTSMSVNTGFNYTKFESGDSIGGSQIVLDEQPSRDPFFSFTPDRGGEVSEDIVVPDAQADVLQIIANEGLQNGDSSSRLASAGFGLSHRLTEHTSFGFDLLGSYRDFDNRARAREGAEGSLRVWTLKNLSRNSDANAYYGFRRSLALDPTITVQNLSGGLGYGSASGRFSFRFSGGVSHFKAEGAESVITPTGSGNVSVSLTRSTSFSAAYSRVYSQSFGFGSTLLVDHLTLALRQQFGVRVSASAIAGASLSSDPLVPDSRLDAYRAGGTVSVAIASGFSAGTSWTLLRAEQEGLQRLVRSDQKLWSVFLRFATSWR